MTLHATPLSSTAAGPLLRFSSNRSLTSTAYCVDIDPHAPYMYEWLNENPSAGPYVRIMRYGSTTLKSAVGV
jgi:hypothetical protein